MSTQKNLVRWSMLLLGATLYMSTASGCRDSMLPVDNEKPAGQQQGGEEFRILVTATSYPLQQNGLHVFSFLPGTGTPGDHGGRNPIDLAFGTIASAPSSTDGKVALMDYRRNVINIYDGNTGDRIPIDIPLAFGTKIVDYSLAISPDGRRIVYAATMEDGLDADDLGDTRRIIVAGTDGSTLATFDVDAADDNEIRFSPDGNRIAFFTEVFDGNPQTPNSGKFCVADIERGNVQEIATIGRIGQEGINTFDWSPNGDKLVYVDAKDGDMFIVTSDGTEHVGLGFGFGPDWSIDEDGFQKILYTDRYMEVAAIDPDRPTSMPQGLGVRGVYPRMAPNGTTFLYFELPQGTNNFQQMLIVHTLDLRSGENLKVVTTHPPFANWLG